MQTYKQALSAGQLWQLGVPGRYFRILGLSAAVTVIFKRNGIPMETAEDVLDGFWSRPAGGFDAVDVISSADQTVMIGITSGEAGYDRAASAIVASGSSSSFTQEALQTNVRGTIALMYPTLTADELDAIMMFLEPSIVGSTQQYIFQVTQDVASATITNSAMLSGYAAANIN